MVGEGAGQKKGKGLQGGVGGRICCAPMRGDQEGGDGGRGEAGEGEEEAAWAKDPKALIDRY